MGFDIQLNGVKVADVADQVDREVEALDDDDQQTDQSRALAQQLASFVKDVLDKVTVASDSEVYIALTVDTGNSGEGTQNWFNVSVTETAQGKEPRVLLAASEGKKTSRGGKTTDADAFGTSESSQAADENTPAAPPAEDPAPV